MESLSDYGLNKYADISDMELLHALKDKNQLAFAELFSRYYDLLYVHAYNKLRNKEDAMDIVQDVFLKLWDRSDDMMVKSNFIGYMYTMTRNAIFTFLSKKIIANGYVSDFVAYKNTFDSITDHRIRERQLSDIIEREIATMPVRMRQVFELSRKQHMSNREIALQLGISEGTVAQHIKLALRLLRVKLGLVLFLAHHLIH